MQYAYGWCAAIEEGTHVNYEVEISTLKIESVQLLEEVLVVVLLERCNYIDRAKIILMDRI